MKVIDTKDYTPTLNLPRKTIPVEGNLPRRQSYFLDKMQDDNKFKQAMQKNKNSKNKYKLTTLPITINQTLSPTIAMNKILKDVFIRHETLKGNVVEDVLIFADDGLAVDLDTGNENDTKKKKIDKSKNQKIVDDGVKKKSEEMAKQFEILKKEIVDINNLGTMINYTNSFYSTVEDDVEFSIINNFLKLFQEGKIHREFRPVSWCPCCKSARTHEKIKLVKRDLYEHYILYHMCEDKKKVLTDITKDDNVYFIGTTIFPWTMIASKCICLAKGEKYSLVCVEIEKNKIYYILASEFVKKFMEYKSFAKYSVIKEFDSEELKSIKVENPLNYTKKMDIVSSKKEYVYADTKHTSGIRIVSLGQNYLDYMINNDIRKYNMVCVVDENGMTNSLSLVYNNTNYIEAGKKIKEFLKQYDFIYYKEKVPITLEYCKKCNTRLLYRCVNEWYIDRQEELTDKIANEINSKMSSDEKYKNEEFPAQINKINAKKQIVISDDKKIGTPIPVLYCAQCGEMIISDKLNLIISDIFKNNPNEIWYQKNVEELVKGEVGCKKCGGAFLFKDEGNINDFFKHLSLPFLETDDSYKNICISSKYMFNKKLHELCFSGKLKETVDKIDRFLIYSNVDKKKTLNISKKVEQKIDTPKENETQKEKNRNNIKFNLFNKLKDETKPSLSKQNKDNQIVVKSIIKNDFDTVKVINMYGTDILRLWALSKSQDTNIRLNKQFIINTNKDYKNIRRTFRYLLSNLADFNPTTSYIKVEDRIDLDKVFYDKLMSLDEVISNAYDMLEYKKVYDNLIKFCTKELCLKYFDIIKYRLYVLKQNDIKRRSTQSTMYDILIKLVFYFEPIIPFTLEEIWPYLWHSDETESKNILTFRDNVRKIDLNIDTEKEKWDRILKIREFVKKYLDKAIATRVVKNKLESQVRIFTDKDTVDFIEENYNDILESLNVSRIFTNISNEKKVEVSKKDGVACARCRHVSIYIGKNLKYQYLCPNCVKILEK